MVYYTNKAEAFLKSVNADQEFKSLLDKGVFTIFKASEVYYPNGKFIPLEMINRIQNHLVDAKAEGFKGLTLSGEMSWAIETKTAESVLATYEYELRKLFDQQSDLWAYCMYDQNVFQGAHTGMQCLCHPIVGKGDQQIENPFYQDFSTGAGGKIPAFLDKVSKDFSAIRQLRGRNALFINDFLWESDKKIIHELSKHTEGSVEFKNLLEARLVVDGYREELTFREKLA